MNSKNSLFKFISVLLSCIIVFATLSFSSFATTPDENNNVEISIADSIVEIAREQIGFYESDINKFTSWYFGYDTAASWCTIFVSWCADQVGAIGTAVPKRAGCLSMKRWFERRNEFYPIDGAYIPRKGDIVFLNTVGDGSDNVHHVEIITENGYILQDDTVNIKSIGGCTSDINYNGSEYVTEKVRPINGSKAAVVGYAHPSYEKSNGFLADMYSLSDDMSPPFFKYIRVQFLEIFFRIELMFAEMF